MKGNLKKHEKNVHLDRLKCSECHRFYRCSEDLRRHSRTRQHAISWDFWLPTDASWFSMISANDESHEADTSDMVADDQYFSEDSDEWWFGDDHAYDADKGRDKGKGKCSSKGKHMSKDSGKSSS